MSSLGQESTISTGTFGKDAHIKLPQLIGSMSISPSGRDVVLASKEGLHIIDLDSPHSPPRFLPHRTPWEVADVQWSPFAERDYWVVSTSNQKALVWNLAAYDLRNSIQHVLHGHTRAITDINFSAHYPDKLATCAVDSFVHCWDLRCPARPVTSFSDWFAGATQVKWSRQDEHVVASSHGKFLHIWDDRNGAYPARTIEAHDGKIYGIDWNRFAPSKIVTCSLDKTVKFWDTNNEENVPERIIETTFPIWRARHTPFGWGLMVMPQRGDGNLYLYDRRTGNEVFENGLVQPVQIFEGHRGSVKEFLWRASGTVIDGIDHRDFQLVSWGADRDLKLHAVSKNTFSNIGYEKGVSRPQGLRFTRRGAKNRTFRSEPSESNPLAGIMSRTESFPMQNQFLRAKTRPSTNIGMSRVPIVQFKGWLQAGKYGRRTDMHGKGVSRPHTDPIAWMRNVKIADALADEITQVGEKFKKVDFESVDVSQRRATMSLQSPWGDSGSAVYTRLDFKFPKGYPKTAQAIVYVAKTNSIGSETQKRLASDIHKIAEVHASRGRGCIEAVVRFLLREQSLEQVVSWITRDSLTDSKIIDEANNPQDGSDDSDDEQMDSLPNVTSSSANVRVPLAKGCAGLWAQNGKLVCFFLPKQKEPASLLSTLGTGRLDDSESSKLFGGFGKFQVDSPSRKAKDAPQTARDDSDSGSSERSSLFSSSISSTDSSVDFEERSRFVPWQRTTLDSLQRGKSVDGSQKSTTLDGTRASDSFKNAVISIHDLSDILPAKESLAHEYKIYGDTFSVCQHNAEAASRYAFHENATIWRIAANTVVSDKTQRTERMIGEDAEFSALLRRMNETRRPEQAWLRISSDIKGDHDLLQPQFAGGFLGDSYLLPAIMQYLDRLCDVQMLATLSAVLLQSKKASFATLSKLSNQTRQQGSTGVAASSGGRDDTSPSHFGPSDNRIGGTRYGPIFHAPNQRLDQTDHSHNTHLEMSMSVPLSVMHTGYLDSTRTSSGAPSVIAYNPSGVVSTVHSTAVSIAGSPENHRPIRRSETSTAFPTATASLHALARSRPPSPPAQSTNRDSARLPRSSKSLRASPDDNFFNDARSKLKSSMSLVNISGYGEDANPPRNDARRLKSILKNDKNGASNRRPKKKLRTRTYNPSLIQTGRSAPLVQFIAAARECVGFIQQYLPLLEAWQLWIQKAEMQHILGETMNTLDKFDHGGAVTLQRGELTNGLEIRRCCPECGRRLDAIEKNGVAIGWHCVSRSCGTRGRRPTKKQRCSICGIVIDGLSMPCLQCGHLTCYECAQGWFAAQDHEDRKGSLGSFKSGSEGSECNRDDPTCPTGCGCPCSTLSTVIVPRSADSVERGARITTTPTTPRSEDYQDPLSRTPAVNEHRPHRGQSIHGPESALNALMALNVSSRHRSLSGAQSSSITAIGPTQNASGALSNTSRTRDNSISVHDELLPWATDNNATLGRGLGAGLSRGLNNKVSDSTIRRSGR